MTTLLIALLSLLPISARAASAPVARPLLGRAGDVGFVQLRADGFEKLSQQDRLFAYHLTQAARAGDTIAYDQMHRDAPAIRNLFQEMLPNMPRASVDERQAQAVLLDYYRQFYSNRSQYDMKTQDKLKPGFTFEELRRAAQSAREHGAFKGLSAGDLDARLEGLRAPVFDTAHEPRLTVTEGDLVAGSAVNFYQPGLTQAEVEAHDAGAPYPVINRLSKVDGVLQAEVYRAGDPAEGIPAGRYAKELSVVIKHLERAIPHASGPRQQGALRHLISFFKSGNPVDFREYNRIWTHDDSSVDFILGFIEMYGDPLGRRPTFEGMISFRDPEYTAVIVKLAALSSGLEARAPWDARYKKSSNVPLIASAVKTVAATGDAATKLTLGVNLPNDTALRAVNGAKNITIISAEDAALASRGSRLLDEFAWDESERELARSQPHASRIQVATHELGHSTGRLSDKLGGREPAEFLKEYASTLEELRAELFGLWAMGDREVQALRHEDGSPIVTPETEEAEYRAFVRAVLVQNIRVPGKTRFINAYDRARNLIIQKMIEQSAVAVESRNGKTYLRVTDMLLARTVVADLLGEVMRIKAEGDYDAAKALYDRYGDSVNITWRDEVIARYAALDIPQRLVPITPRLSPIYQDGTLVDAKVSYPRSLNDATLPRRRRPR